MKKVLVNTNILIDYVNGYNDELGQLFIKQETKDMELYLSPVILSEFLNNKGLKNKEKMKTALEFVDLFQIADINKKTGIIAGELLRNDTVNVLADAFIAAACLQYGLFLFTNNKKDFQKVRALKFR